MIARLERAAALALLALLWGPCVAAPAAASVAVTHGAVEAGPPWTLVEHAGYTYPQGGSIRPRVLSYAASQVRLRVVSVPFEAGQPEASLLDLAQSRLRRAELRRKPWALVNGGLSSYRTDAPLGLLVVDSRVYGTLSRERASSAQRPSASSPQLRWSGVLCRRAGAGGWDIALAERYEPKSCVDAMQSGPLLVEAGGTVGIREDEPERSRPYERSVVCLGEGERMHLVVVERKTHLLPLARWLARPESEGGLGCRVALNLSGDSSSGLVLNDPRTGLQRYGPAAFPLPSALLVEPRERPAPRTPG